MQRIFGDKIMGISENMKIRKYNDADCLKIVELFYNTVHSVNAKDYNKAQLNAWAPEEYDLDAWRERLSKNYTIVAEKGSIITGFGSVDGFGYFDLLFVHKDYQGQGTATLIAEGIEKYALQKGFHRITTESSITARQFFERRGYTVCQEQKVERGGEILVNFIMEKLLNN